LGQPRLLLLDEPSEGLAPVIVRQISELVRQLGGAGLSMLMCEQNAKFALAVADTAYLIEKGCVRHSGPAAEMAMQPELKEFLAV
jgi:branched-chain amino acid transport system ATP-binding protein